MLSFDHTTGRLVIDGTATASADGLTVTTDPGAGVTQPGWHGMAPPGSQGSSAGGGHGHRGGHGGSVRGGTSQDVAVSNCMPQSSANTAAAWAAFNTARNSIENVVPAAALFAEKGSKFFTPELSRA